MSGACQPPPPWGSAFDKEASPTSASLQDKSSSPGGPAPTSRWNPAGFGPIQLSGALGHGAFAWCLCKVRDKADPRGGRRARPTPRRGPSARLLPSPTPTHRSRSGSCSQTVLESLVVAPAWQSSDCHVPSSCRKPTLLSVCPAV